MPELTQEKQLHFLMDHTGQLLDANKALGEDLAKSKDENKASLDALRVQLATEHDSLVAALTRLDMMDKMLPKGQKIYLPLDGSRPGEDNEAKTELARYILDIASFRQEGKPKFGSETFKLAQTEGADDEGGFLVPAEQTGIIMKIVESYGLARQLFTVFPMKGKELRVPTKVTGLTMYWPDESVAPTPESQATLARPAIVAKKMCGIDTLSLEVDEDSIPMIRDFLIDESALAVAKEEDRVGLAGDFSGAGDPFDGILYASGVTPVVMDTGLSTFEEVTWNELLNMQNGIDEFSAERAVWVMSNYMVNTIRRVVLDGADRPLFITGNLTTGMTEGAPGQLLGNKLYKSAVMPKAATSGASLPFIIFGDLKMMGMGDRKQLSIDFSREAGFKTGDVVMRIMERVGFKVLKGAALGRLVTAA